VKTTALEHAALKTGSICSFTQVNSAFSPFFALPDRRSLRFHSAWWPETSRRQYLSRMDRFQHERSGANFRTMSALDQAKIAVLPAQIVA
jgi:hypothetical protein